MRPISQVKVTAMKISTYCEIAGILPQCVSPVLRGVPEQEDVDHRHRHHGEEHREHLRHREGDAHRGLDEVAVDAEEDDDRGGAEEDRELRQVARLGPAARSAVLPVRR